MFFLRKKGYLKILIIIINLVNLKETLIKHRKLFLLINLIYIILIKINKNIIKTNMMKIQKYKNNITYIILNIIFKMLSEIIIRIKNIKWKFNKNINKNKIINLKIKIKIK